jgi:hypothetical protein
VFDTIIVSEYFDDNSFSAVDLYEGKLIKELMTPQTKDIQLRDSNGTRNNFFFRSGDLAKRNPGFLTKFGVVSLNMKRKQFDTLTKIPNASSPPDTLYDFTYDPTITPYYFNPYDTTKQCISFYLKGRFPYGLNGYRRIFGMFLVDSVYRTGVLPDTIKVRIKVKINKDGKNNFKQYL